MTIKYVPAAAIHVGDVVRLDRKAVTILRVSNHDPSPGRILLTDSEARAWGFGASASVQVVRLK